MQGGISRHFGSIRANKKMAPRDERGAGRTRRKRNLPARRLQNRGRSSFAGRTIDAYVRFRTFQRVGASCLTDRQGRGQRADGMSRTMVSTIVVPSAGLLMAGACGQADKAAAVE